MAPGVAAAAAAALRQRTEELARATTDALYAGMPVLLEKYGERGRAKCLQDMRYNLEHLAPAVELQQPELFTRYIGWLRDLLAARGIPAEEVRRSLELTRDVTRARLPAEEAAAVADVVEAGLRMLAEPADA